MSATRMTWTDGKVRQVFALRAEGKTMGAIAGIMGTGNGQVSMILTRVRHADVDITQNVLDKVAAIRPARPGRTPGSKNKPKVLKSEEVNPVMAAAALTAGDRWTGSKDKPPKVKDTRPPASTLEELNLIPPTYQGAVPKPYTEAIDEAHRKITQPVQLVSRTKAQALMNVLGNVQSCNELRQRVSQLRLDAVRLEAEAKSTEDATFEQMAALTKHGFTPEFLSSLLSESGLCSDGKFDVE